MKAHQKRFQEALKRLDREVHKKATTGIYSRPSTARNPLKSLEGESVFDSAPKTVRPPTTTVTTQKRAVRQQTAERKKRVPQEPESFKSANPRTLIAMLKIPKNW